MSFRPPADAWSRRDLMRNGFGSIALLCTFAAPDVLRPRKATVTSAAIRSQAKSPFTPFQQDLPRIPELVPVATSRTRDTYAMTVREGMAEVLPGFQTPIYGYDGVYPGPLIRAKKGREVVVRQTNGLPFETNVHLHGGYVPAEHDGHPMDVIPAGGHFDYKYPNDQDAATLWYHDHAHGRTSKTLYYGLVSMYILEDDLETELRLPQGEFDVPLVLADHAFNKDGSFRYAENVDIGFRGDTLLVNGAISPRMAVQRRKYRLRFLNASNARSYALRLGGGRPMTQIAGDGGLLARPVPRTNIPLHPAERVDIVIDFSAYGPGEELVLYNTDAEANAGTTPIMRFDIEGGKVSEDFRVPSRLRDPEPLPAPNARRRWELALGTAAWQINGLGWDPNRIDVRPRLGSTELWTFVNNSNRVHPMHLHGFLFRILERSSAPVALADRLGWKDTVGVLPNETVTVLAWFAPYRGKYVFHCHALEHADKAMMLQMEIV
ncbi:multicopper oxidase domain-containing protein [Solirubrobacter taibaiensis]|nr:multicopper oxidase domain-containing protein [Solirubrobacter taibaiensis]